MSPVNNSSSATSHTREHGPGVALQCGEVAPSPAQITTPEAPLAAAELQDIRRQQAAEYERSGDVHARDGKIVAALAAYTVALDLMNCAVSSGSRSCNNSVVASDIERQAGLLQAISELVIDMGALPHAELLKEEAFIAEALASCRSSLRQSPGAKAVVPQLDELLDAAFFGGVRPVRGEQIVVDWDGQLAQRPLPPGGIASPAHEREAEAAKARLVVAIQANVGMMHGPDAGGRAAAIAESVLQRTYGTPLTTEMVFELSLRFGLIHELDVDSAFLATTLQASWATLDSNFPAEDPEVAALDHVNIALDFMGDHPETASAYWPPTATLIRTILARVAARTRSGESTEALRHIADTLAELAQAIAPLKRAEESSTDRQATALAITETEIIIWRYLLLEYPDVAETCYGVDGHFQERQAALLKAYAARYLKLQREGDRPNIMRPLRDSISIMERMVRLHPNYLDLLHESYRGLGMSLEHQGNLPEAQEAFSHGLAVAQRLSTGDLYKETTISQFYIDLGRTYIKAGDVNNAQRELLNCITAIDRADDKANEMSASKDPVSELQSRCLRAAAQLQMAKANDLLSIVLDLYIAVGRLPDELTQDAGPAGSVDAIGGERTLLLSQHPPVVAAAANWSLRTAHADRARRWAALIGNLEQLPENSRAPLSSST